MTNLEARITMAATVRPESATSLSIALLGDSKDIRAQKRSQRLALQLGLPLVGAVAAKDYDLILTYTPERLELRDNRHPRFRPVYVDFSTKPFSSGNGGLSRRQPLALAVGKRVRTIVDATTGLGQDSHLLAWMGYSVIAMERCPVIAALLHDALDRLYVGAVAENSIGTRLDIVTADARLTVPTLKPQPDAIYLDPMFPPKRKKSALAKKEIMLLRELVGNDPDAEDLLQISRQAATRRVIVKRHLSSPPLGQAPDKSYRGKLARYDVYYCRTRRP